MKRFLNRYFFPILTGVCFYVVIYTIGVHFVPQFLSGYRQIAWSIVSGFIVGYFIVGRLMYLGELR